MFPTIIILTVILFGHLQNLIWQQRLAGRDVIYRRQGGLIQSEEGDVTRRYSTVCVKAELLGSGRIDQIHGEKKLGSSLKFQPTDNPERR